MSDTSLVPLRDPANSHRPAPGSRTFASTSVEGALDQISTSIADAELARLFIHCFPNTLDTTTFASSDDHGHPDTYVITGDIDAMWLRDSAAQVWPYLPLAREDKALGEMITGVIRRQAKCVLLDPYANAFYREPVLGYWKDDYTEMRPGVHERKWELDSLAYFFRLSHGYWEQTADHSPFDQRWLQAVEVALRTLRTEQCGDDEVPGSPYSFRRGNGSSPNARRARCGLVRGAFRPSDDASRYPFLVPANAMLTVVLGGIGKLLRAMGQTALALEAETLRDEVLRALEHCAVVRHPRHGEIWAYEVDGMGGQHLMDDANAPSLLSLPYLGFCDRDDPRYLRTRSFCLSPDNPHFVAGRAAEGIGSPHTGPGTIWPMAVIMRALTATRDQEILDCLRILRTTHAETGFMHESFDADDPSRFTRSWFAWANTLFGELIATLHRERPHLLSAGRPAL